MTNIKITHQTNTPCKHHVKHVIKCDDCGRKQMSDHVKVCQSCGGWMRYSEDEMKQNDRGEYPKDWASISKRVKEEAHNQCVRCGHVNDFESGYVLTVQDG